MLTVPGSSIDHTMRRKGRVVSIRNHTFAVKVKAEEEHKKERAAIAEKGGLKTTNSAKMQR